MADARGVLAAFEKLGFERVAEPLFDDQATSRALHHLVTDGLRRLDPNDSLVLFFAGHGHTITTTFADGTTAKQGYLIPVDAEDPGGGIGTWLDLESWLRRVAHLPPKHILVVLDACHSGIALNVTRWRDAGTLPEEAFEQLRARRSRRVMTSALDDERAMDSGPRHDHSLFTGCLLEALDDGLTRAGRRRATGSDLFSYVRHRVAEVSKAKQTPDFGALDFDDRGELVVELRGPAAAPAPTPPEPKLPPKPRSRGVGTSEHPRRNPSPKPGRDQRRKPHPKPGGPVARPDGSLLDAAFVAALDRQDAVRLQSGDVLSIVSGDSAATLADWAAWAAGRGYLTLVTEGASLDAAIGELLAQTPWLRCLAGARRCLAAAAGLEVEAVDAALDARSGDERSAWIDDVAGLDPCARVSGWLLSVLREPRAGVPDLSTAPVQGGALLFVLCELATPIAVLVHHAAPAVPWLERAISTAAALMAYLPGRSIAVGAPHELVARVLGGDLQSAALSMARQGMVPVAARAPRPPDRAPGRRARVLHDALAGDPRTAGLFALNVRVPIRDGGPDVDVELVAGAARLAVPIDGWYHHADPQGYRRDRDEDVRLQRAGYFVMRFAAEDIDQRLVLVVNEIAIGLGGRRASGACSGESP